MKMTKKIFIGLLTLAVLVSGLAISAFAETADTTPKTNYGAILDYYEQPVFIEEKFNTATEGDFTNENLLNGASKKDHSGQYATIVKDADGNQYISLKSGTLGTASSYGNYIYRWNSDSPASGLVADFDFSGAHDGEHYVKCADRRCSGRWRGEVYTDAALVPDKCPGCGGEVKVTSSHLPIVRFYINDEPDNAAAGQAGTTGKNLIEFNMQDNKITYMTGADTTESVDFTFKADTWYKASVTVDAATNTYSFKLVDAKDNKAVAEKSGIASPISLIFSVKIGSLRSDNNGASTLNLDNLIIMGGSTRRDNTKKQEETEKAFALFVKDIQGASIEDKEIMIHAFDTIVNKYEFTTTNPETLKNIETLKVHSATVYADALKEGVDTIDTKLPYLERLSHVKKYNKYYERIPKDLSALTPEKQKEVKDIVAAYEVEVNALDKISSDSKRFVEITAPFDFTTEDYAVLNKYYAEASQLEYDKSIAGVEEQIPTFEIVESKVTVMKKQGDAFIKAVDAIETATDFENKYNNYKAAIECYFDNETYPGITETLAKYKAAQAELDPIVDACVSYIENVKGADYALYISAKEDYLAKAKTLESKVQDTFPGVKEAKTLATKIAGDIDTLKASAKAYIEAVNALDKLTGDELAKGIKKAEELKKTGNIMGVEGITDANIKLDQKKADLEIVTDKTNQFVTLVSRIAEAKTLRERFDAIKLAINANPGDDIKSSAITGAKATLDSAIAAYNKDVDTANAAFAALNRKAADASVSVFKDVDAAAIGPKVVAFIKELLK